MNSKHVRVLGLAPSSYGCGFAVMEGKSNLIAWGTKKVRGDKKNIRTLSHVCNLIAHYRPTVIAIKDTRSKGSRRSARIRALLEKIVKLAMDEKVRVKRYSRKQVSLGLLAHERGTKHDVAEYLASRFRNELGLRLPPKRRAWDNEDSRMDVFDSVALAEQFLKVTKNSR